MEQSLRSASPAGGEAAERAAAWKRTLLARARELGLDYVGVTVADPFPALRERLLTRQAAGYATDFEESDWERRVDPRQSLPTAQSIVSVAVPYPHRLVQPPRSSPGERRGFVARASWGKDYHRVLRERLNQLAAFLQAVGGTTQVMVDTGPLVDRAVAERAGVGFIGKNTLLIQPDAGSWVFLGEILTDIVLPPDEPLENLCGNCTRCLDACPTQALVAPYRLNAQACLSYWTQTKEPLTDAQNQQLGNRLYGCDTCQLVCPFNRELAPLRQPLFFPVGEEIKPRLESLLTLSNRQFDRLWKHLAGAWRGRTPWQRNALLGLAHFRETRAVPAIARCLDDPRFVIRATAIWALGRIGNEEARRFLQQVSWREKDPLLQQQLQQAWQRSQAD